MKNYSEFINHNELFKRHKDNPILTPADWPYPINSVFNPGAVIHNRETLLLARVEDMRGMSHLTVARSKDGITNWQIDKQPTIYPNPDEYPEEKWGLEDPRITWLEEIQKYAITCTAFSETGPLVTLILTKDFKTFEHCGPITMPVNKDAALFPRKIKDRWMLIHRPMLSSYSSEAHMWVSSSPDLKHWGDHSILMKARNGGWWDANKIGLNISPIETSEGWLLIYHGVRTTASSSLYRLGLALLDLENPQKVIYRGSEWVMGPREVYECMGDVPYAIFPCGATVNSEKDEVNIYYGAADMSIALATARLSELIDFVKSNK